VWKRDGADLPDQTDSCLVIEAVSEVDEGRYCVTVQGYCGEPVTQCSSLYVGDCVEYCGLTQGAYGNAGGKWNGLTTLELLDLLITDGNPLVVGVPGARSLSFPEGTESCIITLLPGGGPAHPLPANLGDAVIDPITCDVDDQFRMGRGRIRNSLLAQTLTLSLNVRLDPNLPNLPLCLLVIMIPILPGPDGIRGTADDVPDNEHPRIVELSPALFTALDYLGLPHTAGGVLSLANLALADELSGQAYVQLGDIVQAVGSVNDLVDECALTIHCESPAEPQAVKINDDRHLAQPGGTDPGMSSREFAVRVLTPNPLRAAGRLSFSVNLPERSRVEAAVYSLGGRVVSRIDAQELDGGDHTLEVDLNAGGDLASGIYFLRLVALGEESGRRRSESRKLVLLQ
jgi:hypothetical protein